MKLSPSFAEVFRYEITLQSRRASTWLYFAALLAMTVALATQAYVEKARGAGYHFNAPITIAEPRSSAACSGCW